MSEMTTYRWSFPEDVAEYSQAGIAAIGVWRPKLAEFGEERGVELLHDSGLSVSSLSWAGGFTGSNGHSFRESVDDAADAIRLAGAMDADCVVIVSGSRAGHTVRHARRLLVEALDELSDLAECHDVLLAVQPIHRLFAREWSFLTTIDDALEAIDGCGSDRVRMAFNAYHLWQEPRLLERIPGFARMVGLVQLSDWRDPPRSEHDRCLPGEGRIPLAEIVAALSACGYNGFYELDIWSETLWNSDYHEILGVCLSRFQSLCSATAQHSAANADTIAD